MFAAKSAGPLNTSSPLKSMAESNFVLPAKVYCDDASKSGTPLKNGELLKSSAPPKTGMPLNVAKLAKTGLLPALNV